MERLNGYKGWSVICTVTGANLQHLTKLVDFFHDKEVPNIRSVITVVTLNE